MNPLWERADPLAGGRGVCGLSAQARVLEVQEGPGVLSVLEVLLDHGVLLGRDHLSPQQGQVLHEVQGVQGSRALPETNTEQP